MQQNELPTPRKGGWMKWALIGSLALNLAVAGLVAGAIWRHDVRDAREGRGAPPNAYGAFYMRALSPEARRAVLRAVRQDGKTPGRAERRAQFRSVLDELRADPFDQKALESAVAEQSASSFQALSSAQTAWLQVVSEMTPEDRKSYAKRIERELKRGPRDR